MARLFVAIDIPAELNQGIEAFLAPFLAPDTDVRWTPAENRHLTLQFLGSVDESKIVLIEKSLQAVAGTVQPFSLSVRGLGAFPDWKKPAVFWLGIEEKTGRLSKLALDVKKAMETLGFALEDRAFTAHLTIARVKSLKTIGQLSGKLQKTVTPAWPRFQPNALALYQSDTRAEGPVYAKIVEFNFR